MAVIHVLDQHTAELIAAGEVVERPASVVKELLENSIDAGATQVTVELERGGISLIRISDNGSGIDTEYVPTAFIRHATSKIRTEEDLDSIHTLGFRGEALASIASVARVQLLTRTEDEEFAALYRIEGGQELGLETVARPQGTTIEVRDLFYNTPARMKFLKKDATEGTYVSEVVSRIALSHPEVAIRLVRDGKQQFATAGDGSLRSAAYAVLGREFARDLLELEPTGEGPYRLSGLLTAPRGCRASRSMQFFFINGRFVKNRTMMAALENAYKGTLMQGKFPGCVLNLEMPPQLVDVNVHPAKTEVRFAREGDVFDAVYRAVKTVVTRPAAGERVFSFAQSGAKPGAAVQAPQKPAAAPVPAPAKPAAPAVQPAPRPAAVVSVAAQATSGLRLGVAQDEAFHFYYEENFELLRERGVELVFFSPLHDRDLPPELDGLWFGGGYPELFAETLAENDAMLDAVRSFAASGRVVWGECGGFLYLLDGLTGFDGVRYPMLGLLPGEGKMHNRLSALGYREAVTAADGLFGPAGTRIQGHEFHYSSAELPAGTQPFFHARTLHGETSEAGSVRNRIAGSYLHLHFASNPAALDHFVKELAR